MKNTIRSYLLLSIVYVCSLAVTCLGAEKLDFWNTPRKGANCFNVVPEERWFREAHQVGIEWVRLAYEKWAGKHRDFLMGNADRFSGIVPEDLETLKQVLAWAQAHSLKVVITPLGLPGNRWVQKNGNQRDLRLWHDKSYWQQAADFWGELAGSLKGHPAVVGYNLLNEPTPEMGSGLPEDSPPAAYGAWYGRVKGSARDLPAFYEMVIAAIRKADPETPVIVDSGWYARPAAFSFWPRLSAPNVLYSIHMYEPYAFTNRRNFQSPKPYRYPGPVPFADGVAEWNKARIEEYLSPFFGWAAERGIPANRLMVGEFGCYRRNPGCAAYLSDVLEVVNARRVHWAFYSFREDEWDGFDYEVGTKGLGERYWKARDAGRKPIVPRADNPLFQVLKKEFSPPSPTHDHPPLPR